MPNFKKIFNLTLFLFVFLLPLQTRLFLISGEINGGYSEYLTISLYFSDILLIITLISGFIYYFKSNFFVEKKSISIFWYIISGLDLVFFISIMFAFDYRIAIYKYVLFLAGIALVFLLSNIKIDINRLFFVFLTSTFIVSGLGIWQFILQKSFSSEWFGLAFHSAGELGSSIVGGPMGGRWIRSYGSLDHPNMFGGLIVMAILITFYQLYRCNINKKIEIIYFVYLIFYSFSLYFSFSRSAYLSLLVSLFFIILYLVVNKRLKNIKKLIQPLFIVFLSLAACFFLYGGLFVSRLDLNNRVEEKSINERVVQLSQVKDIIQKYPLFGSGIGNYILALKELDKTKESWFYQPVHNVYILVFAEVGVFGFVLFLFMFFYIASYYKKIEVYFFVLPLVILMLFDHWLWSLHFGILFFWLIVAIYFVSINNKGRNKLLDG